MQPTAIQLRDHSTLNSIKWQEFMRVAPNTAYERESTLFFISSAQGKHILSSGGHHEDNSSAPSLKKACSKSSAVSMVISVIKMKFSEFKSYSGLEAARCEFDHEVQIESLKQEQSGSHERGAQDFLARLDECQACSTAQLGVACLKLIPARHGKPEGHESQGKWQSKLEGEKSPKNWVENPNPMLRCSHGFISYFAIVLDSGSDHYLEYTNDPMSILQKLVKKVPGAAKSFAEH
ncbi:hypothetical protein K438DRAFT_1766383 [Mycena galopus ATCC 62051]|nr:hypothetical protein K438DRAFT_1766383 [Mycena galopus ATCC 62051]